jgi:outer membrane protein
MDHALPLQPSRPARSAVFCGLLLSLPAAHADEPTPPAAPAPAPPSSSWGLGVGLIYQQNTHRDVDDQVLVLPLLSYENRWVRLSVPSVDLKLLPDGPLDLALRLRYEGAPYQASDSPALAGMQERKGGLWAGAALRWRGGLGDLGLDVSGDASGHSNGTQVKLSLGQGFRLGRLGLTPRLAVSWMDRKYVDFNYGVSATEALATRPAYAGRATANIELGLSAGYGLTRSGVLFVDLGATWLGQAIQDSPIVDARTVGGARLGYLHRL